MNLDLERLRNDLKHEYLGAYYGGGFGGALIESFKIDNATPNELIRIANKLNIDLNKYIIDNNKRRR